MQLEVVVLGVDITDVRRSQGSSSTYSGTIRVQITPPNERDGPLEMSVPFTDTYALSNCVTQALRNLRDYGSALAQAAIEAKETYI